MPFDWREYLELARELAGLRGSGYSQETADRSAVSRAYYAAFCWARNYAEAKLGFRSQKTADDHKLLREHLKRQGHQELASDLNRLRVWRNNCDYDDDVPNLRQQASNSIRLAEKVIQQCV
jgi:uncharacterized protein (UPF0332 family)